MKYSESEGTDINNKTYTATKFSFYCIVLLITQIQAVFAGDLYMFSQNDEVIAITNIDGNENLLFKGVLTDGLYEAVQTHLTAPVSKSNSDGTGGKSNSDGTGEPESLLTVLIECNSEENYQATGLVESENNTIATTFEKVYLDSQLIECNQIEIDL